MNKKKEVRTIEIDTIEVRNINNLECKIIEGYVNKFNKPSVLMKDFYGDEFIEVISENAFLKTLEKKNQKALWNHNVDYVLGSVESGTLKLFTDSIGLRCEITLPNTSWGNDAYESIKRGDVNSMSFGFVCNEDYWTTTQYENREVYKRTILDVELLEISPCVFPAYPDSSINCRSYFIDNKKEEKRKKLILKTYL